MPDLIVTRLNETVTAALANDEIKKLYGDLGGIPMPMIPAEFGRFIRKDTDRWSKVVSSTGTSVE
jgi:tripartite-type tricarboxylate transporter receptor subunit TctC